jgi:hypothetical protein
LNTTVDVSSVGIVKCPIPHDLFDGYYYLSLSSNSNVESQGVIISIFKGSFGVETDINPLRITSSGKMEV